MARSKLKGFLRYGWGFLAVVPNTLFVYSAILSERKMSKELEEMPFYKRRELYKRDYLLRNNSLYLSGHCLFRKISIDSYEAVSFSPGEQKEADRYAQSMCDALKANGSRKGV